MRKFKVGDRVRWYEVGDMPLWGSDFIQTSGGSGHWVEGKVSQSYDTTLLVDGWWWWPQPGHEQARYGEPGYLELVEAVKEPQFSIRTVEGLDRLRIFYKDACKPETGFPEYCRPELEAICKKMNDGGGEK